MHSFLKAFLVLMTLLSLCQFYAPEDNELLTSRIKKGQLSKH